MPLAGERSEVMEREGCGWTIVSKYSP
jgi:hypothetical protein